ncbi:hypothetical protein Cgig2_027962 [Carnegiea gigantea]|uniref:N-acetyltransferase domain-containing protein n=1 Tax=Carnegiea gigantea TaxID=171969 RepID=A0A9Q1JVF1_9CARY|nr:hypothetical protein Cgig2_027962 [Carnegiea gigantea]
MIEIKGGSVRILEICFWLAAEDSKDMQYHLSDIDVFMESARNPDVLFYSKLQHWLQPNSSREDFVSYVEEAVIPRPRYRAICFDKPPIGYICIEPAGTEKWTKGRALLSFGLDRHYWVRGIATSAIREAVSAAFREIHGLVRIEAVVRPDNKASQHVLEKLGFPMNVYSGST